MGNVIFHPGGAVEIKTENTLLVLTREEFVKAVRRGKSVLHNRTLAAERGNYIERIQAEPTFQA